MPGVHFLDKVHDVSKEEGSAYHLLSKVQAAVCLGTTLYGSEPSQEPVLKVCKDLQCRSSSLGIVSDKQGGELRCQKDC